MHKTVAGYALTILCGLMLASCAVLKPGFEPLKLSVVSLTALPAQGLEQRFRIGLRITNPNPDEIRIKGFSFDLSLNGYELLSGVSGEVKPLAGFSDTVISVDAGSSLVNSLRFINEAINNPRDVLHYEIKATLHLNMPFANRHTVVDRGQISLGSAENSR
jgi:LEA14-like dessication related protein